MIKNLYAYDIGSIIYSSASPSKFEFDYATFDCDYLTPYVDATENSNLNSPTYTQGGAFYL